MQNGYLLLQCKKTVRITIYTINLPHEVILDGAYNEAELLQ